MKHLPLVLLFLSFPVFLYAAFMPRQAPDESVTLTRVKNGLREAGAAFEERSLLEAYGGFGSSIIVRINGSNLGASTGTGGPLPGPAPQAEAAFVLAAPLGMDYAVDTALELVKAALLSPPKEDILVAFLGNESTVLSSSPGYLSHIGLGDLLTLPAMPESWILCYLDLERPPQTILIRHGSGEYIAPLDIVKPLPGLFETRGIKAKFEIQFNGLYKLLLAAKNEVLDLAWQGEINSFSLGGENSDAGGGNTGGAAMETGVFASILLEYGRTLEFPVRNPDRHYSFFTLPFSGKIIFISEKVSVLIFVIIMAMILLFGLSYSAATFPKTGVLGKPPIKLFFRHSWIFLVFLPLLVLIIKGSGFFYDALLFIFNKPAPIADYPGLVFILLLAIWLFYIPSKILDSLIITGKENFYGETAIILSGFGLLIAAFIDFTYTRIFLWVFFFSFLGFGFKKHWAVFLSALFIPLPAVLAFVNLYKTRSPALTNTLINTGFTGGWLASLELAVLSLPAFFLLKKGAFLFNFGKKQKIWNISLKFRFAFLGVLLFGMLLYAFTLPGFLPLQIRRQIIDDSFTAIKTGSIYFRESHILEISFEAKKNPVRFDIYLESGGEEGRAIVYSAPFPFEYADNGEIVFILGENPRNPLKAEIVFPRNLPPAFRVCAVYNTYDEAIDPEGVPESPDYEFQVISRSSLNP
ncbi:MAG: hypothetical protein LBF78_05245 [Treponema sp.]|jgi:hypothetical protein|nr:hypothetical protein [Treponema sp.]